MEFDLSGKTALVTGGAKRLGRAISLSIAEHGADVVVHYRSSRAEAESTAQEVRAMGRQAWVLRADLSIQDELGRVVDGAMELAGRLDILINNASSFPASELETLTLDQLMDSIKVEAWAPLVVGRGFASRIGSGHVVNVLDTRVSGYDWKHAAYHAAKHMLGLFTREMAVRFAPKVAVNAVAPGLILPPAGKDRTYLEGLKGTVPLNRIGDPRDVTEAVLYLVTSRFVTGQVIFVDGGRRLLEPENG